MKDFCKIEEDKYGKFYYNEKDKYHRLTGPAVEYKNGNKYYYINSACYIEFNENNNKLFISTELLGLNSEYDKYIKQNIKDLIKEYNPKIELSSFFTKEKINKLPDWLKDLIIL